MTITTAGPTSASKAPLRAPGGRNSTASAPTTTHVLVPDGPFSLDLARTAVMRWAPVSRFARDAARPLVLAAIADDDLRPVAFALTQDAVDGPVTVEITGTGDPDAARAQVARILSLDHDASGLVGPGSVATRDPAVGAVLARSYGRRPTLFPSVYEAAAWAVISPRIGTTRAATLTRRLAAEHGETLALAGESIAVFPTPETLLGLDGIPGLPAEKVRRLHGVARAALDGELDVARLRALGPDGARAALRRIRGVGEFWSSGIWLRACGVVDEWPDEPRATAALARLHGRDPRDYDDPAVLAAATAPLAPYRMWVAFLLRMGDA
jgi:DNA-3-methyladenine glycosylase II